MAVAQYLSSIAKQGDDESLAAATLFLSGSIFPRSFAYALNVGYSTVMASLLRISDLTDREIKQSFLKFGDMGALAEYAVSRKRTVPLLSRQLSLMEVQDGLKRMAQASGPSSGEAKKKTLTGLLINCSPLEAKYLVKIIGGELRIGTVGGTVELSLANVFGLEVQQIRLAVLLSGDIAQVAVLAKRNELKKLSLRPLIPFSFMLADVMFSAEEIVKYYDRELVCEYKYDGARAQLHKFGGEVKLFSRNLDDITRSFPEIERAASSVDADFVLDGEIVAYQDDRPLHFQALQRRLRRKTITKDIVAQVPAVYLAYDILYSKGSQTIAIPLSERKKIIASVELGNLLRVAPYWIVRKAEEIVARFNESRNIGHEGLMLKVPDSVYFPGKRGRHWVKLKRELDTIDAVVVAAEYGHGKRAGTLSDYTFAVSDGMTQLKTIGKAYSGLTDDEIEEMTLKLQTEVTNDNGFRLIVRPEIVLEIAFDSIQKSDRHNSGYALRFPRIKRIRTDKTVKDIDTLEKVKMIYDAHAKLKNSQ